MTKGFRRVIVSAGIKKGPQVRKGKAMLKAYKQNYRSMYSSYELLGTFMSSAEKYGQFNIACLFKAGSSGYSDPGVSLRTPE